jgi:glycosyltransferase involved in cell wall biosynthesis
VHFLGLRTDIDSILRGADVAALSSDYEGLPLFVLECFVNGTPLVATDVGGLPDVVSDGVNGLLVPRGDVGALAEALTGLLRDPVRRAQMSANAEQTASRYTMDATAERVASLYETLISDN